MKKIQVLSLLMLIVLGGQAQDLTSKRGENFLPEPGEWAIGLDASPFLNFAGNLFNSENSSPQALYINNINTFYGKMFFEDQKAYRAKVRIGFNNMTNRESVEDANDPSIEVTDKEKISSTFIGLGAGVENRRGNSRLQGLFGAEAFLWFSGSKVTYEYGNSLSADNQSNDNVFNSDLNDVTELSIGSTVGVQLRGFIGAEYFILPKISLGAEYGWGLTFSRTADGERISQFWNDNSGEAETSSTSLAGNSSVSVDTDINNSSAVAGDLGNISLTALFHF
ncbi:MAG: hypothetical protein AAF487_14360 [Bacteroidota bacterium]